MQGLVHYSDDSSPEPQSQALAQAQAFDPNREAGPSRLRDVALELGSASSSSSALPRSTIKAKRQAGIVLAPRANTPSAPTSDSQPQSNKRARLSPGKYIPNSSSSTPTNARLPENLTHTAQSDLRKSELLTSSRNAAVKGSHAASASGSGAGAALADEFEGLDDDQILRIVTAPNEIPGVEHWGIPPAVDPIMASDSLKAKVTNFLRLKEERGEHINTRLLSSSAFANPHIYSKLVEFVQIDERASAFPSHDSTWTNASAIDRLGGEGRTAAAAGTGARGSGGWLTRRYLESLIPTYGPKVLAAQQKAREEAVKASQKVGARREIGFAPSKYGSASKSKSQSGDKDAVRERERDRRNGSGSGIGGERRKDRGAGTGTGTGTGKDGWDKYGDEDRERDRDRERERDRKRDKDRSRR